VTLHHVLDGLQLTLPEALITEYQSEEFNVLGVIIEIGGDTLD
jgi:hypothetical protein